MTQKLKSTIFIVLILLNIPLYGQEMLGLGFGNYSGISSKNINPAFLTGSKVYLDINVVGAGLSIENNFAYLPNQSGNIWSVIRGDSLPKVYGPYDYNGYITRYPDKPKYSIYGMGTVMGPGVMIQNGKHAFGISVSFRNYESASRIPGNLARDAYDHISFQKQLNKVYDYKNIGATSLSWAELSFNYAYDFYERYGIKLTGGVELKLLYGIEGAYSETTVAKYHWASNSNITIDTLNTTLAMALPLNYNDGGTDFNPWHKGHGLGMNIGFLYTKNASNVKPRSEKALCAKPYEDYKYRIGFSILDIGSIRFNNNTRIYHLHAQNLTLDANQIQAYGTLDITMNSLLDSLNLDTTAIKTSNIFMSLPTALSLQADYHWKKNIYVSGFWIHPLRFKKRSLRRPAELAIIPRYDTRMLGISVPVTWFDYQQLRLGLALRIYTVTIGTEKLGTLLGLGNLNGLDCYFNIKINLEKGTCVSWKKGACHGND